MPRRARLLIIDDSPVLFHSLEESYNQEFSISRVADGEAGIAQATSEPPDLIIFMELPEQEVSTTIDILRSDPMLCTIPVLVLLAESTAGKALRAEDPGAEQRGTRTSILKELLIPRLRGLLKSQSGFEFDEEEFPLSGLSLLGESTQIKSLRELCQDFAHVL